MAFFTRLRIGRRLGLAFATIVTLTLLAAIAAQVELQEVGQRARELTTLHAERTSLAYRWREGIVVNATRAATLGAVTDAGLVAKLNADMAETTANISKIQKRLELLDTTAKSRDIAKRMAELRKSYIAVRTDMLKKASADPSIAAAVARSQAISAFQEAAARYIGITDELVKYEEQQATDAGVDIATAVRMSSVVSLGAALACALVSVLLGVAITRSIVRPVREAQLAAERIAAGDLTGELHAHGDDEAARLVESLGQMQVSLRRIVHEIRQSTDSIQLASAEVAMGNQDLSQRTEKTAGSLQQAASSMEELTTAVRHSADAAAQANGLAGSASDAASRGGKVVSQVVSTMDEINLSSKKIADIVGTIDGIAFQTNILALNAAVEAARAGEQGRGFAVVAGEVRTLAQRSAEAAKEIKALIGTSVAKVETGARLVEDAGSVMAQIVNAVRRVSDVIGEISTSAGEQAGGLEHVNEAVVTVDQMTQQNAALVEQSAAAAEAMRDQATRLAKTVELFKTA
jgi:methyl-accepting chemotaxis protein